MRKWLGGAIFVVALMAAQAASAYCGLCDAYWPCSTPCLHCMPTRFEPGLWTFDGYCMGEIVEGTCGDTGNCGLQHSSSLSCPSFFGPGGSGEPAALEVPVLVPSAASSR